MGHIDIISTLAYNRYVIDKEEFLAVSEKIENENEKINVTTISEKVDNKKEIIEFPIIDIECNSD